MTKMNPEVKTLWIAALRSGDYAQGKGSLTLIDDDGKRSHCCLGVLCDLAVKAGVVEASPRHAGYMIAYDESTALLPSKVRDWAGLYTANPTLAGICCSGLNDAMGKTFPEIADLIETWL